MALVDARTRDPSAYGTSEAGVDYADPASAGQVEPDTQGGSMSAMNKLIEGSIVIGGLVLGGYLVYRLWRAR